jgi:hypothetical protein
MEKKEYCGSGKRVKDWDLINVSLKYDKLKPNELGWVNIVVQGKKVPDEWGRTHIVYLNTWKPIKQTQQTSAEF